MATSFEHLFDSIAPPAAEVAEMDPEDASENELYSSELAQIASAIATRRREYAAGRILARVAMGRCGVAATPLLNGPDRAPIWPAAVVGSISHTAGHAVAMAAPRGDLKALGCDIEVRAALPDRVDKRILLPREQGFVAATSRWYGRLIFSAKESVYKSLYPTTKRFINFHEVEIDLDLDRGKFVINLYSKDGKLPYQDRLRGRFSFNDRFLGTVVWIET